MADSSSEVVVRSNRRRVERSNVSGKQRAQAAERRQLPAGPERWWPHVLLEVVPIWKPQPFAEEAEGGSSCSKRRVHKQPSDHMPGGITGASSYIKINGA